MRRPNNTIFNHTFLKVILSISVIILSFVLMKAFDTYAASVTTSVTVGNAAPHFDTGPAENPASTTTTPTNVDSNVTFQATGHDNSSENYYLAVCKTDSITPTNGGAPTCATDQTLCVSTATTSQDQASCNFGVTAANSPSESYAWYAFVCDGNASNAKCSTSQQGTGDSGSPFAVNHRPTFNSAGITDATVDPGTDPEWVTDSSTLDGDTGGTQDQVKLIVCKTTGLTDDACDGGGGDTWCSSSYVNSNPSCTYLYDAPAPDETFDAYVYLVDSHYLPAATGGHQESNIQWTINNVAPVVSSVAFNGGSAIDLTESSTKNADVTFVVTDNNSCYGGELATVYAYAYRSGVGYTSCDTSGEADNDNCYPEITCSVDSGVNDCTGTTDASAAYKCTVALQYYAEPTDTGTPYDAETWLTTGKVIDDDAESHNLELGTGIEMNSLTAASISSTLPYGSVEVEGTIDPLSITTTTTATGNVGLDQELSGTQMCVDYPTCSGGTPITVGYQKYALVASTSYASGTSLTGSAVETELNVLKPDTEDVSPFKYTYWGINIPTGTVQAEYTGADTLTAVKGEYAEW